MAPPKRPVTALLHRQVKPIPRAWAANPFLEAIPEEQQEVGDKS